MKLVIKFWTAGFARFIIKENNLNEKQKNIKKVSFKHTVYLLTHFFRIKNFKFELENWLIAKSDKKIFYNF